MSPFLRKVKTASGATAVQIAVKEGRRDKVIEHLGSAHTEAELAALMEIGRHRIAPDQLALDLTPTPPAVSGLLTASAPVVGTDAVVASKRSGLLWDVLHGVYTRLGLRNATGGDRAFEQMVLARLIEPTSKAQVPASWVTWAWSRSAPGPCSAPWPEPRSEATARACLGLCSSTSPPVGAWPCACRRDHPVLRGRA